MYAVCSMYVGYAVSCLSHDVRGAPRVNVRFSFDFKELSSALILILVT